MITNYPMYIQGTLSSKLFEYAYKHIFSSIELGTSAYQYNKHALIKLPIRITEKDCYISDREVYTLYGISDEEIEFIELQ